MHVRNSLYTCLEDGEIRFLSLSYHVWHKFLPITFPDEKFFKVDSSISFEGGKGCAGKKIIMFQVPGLQYDPAVKPLDGLQMVG